MKLKKICLITAALFIGGLASANTELKSIEQIVEKNSTRLMKDGKIIATSFEETPVLSLIPQSQNNSVIKSSLIKKEKKNFYFTYEALYFIPKTITVQKAGELARSISKMQGINYYSNTKKKEVVLYKQAFTVADASSKKPLADKTTGSADGKTIYALLDDNSFGETRYKISYKQSEQELLASFVNCDDMGLGPIRAIMPEKLIINLQVIPCEEGIVVYLCADLESKNLPGVKAKITDSITARIEAISKWFISLV